MRRLLVALFIVAALVGCTRGPPFQHLAMTAGTALPDGSRKPALVVSRGYWRPHPTTTTTTMPERSRIATKGVEILPPMLHSARAGLIWRIAACESGTNYTAQNRYSSASGAWQDLDSTWNHAFNVARAMYATPAQQYAFNLNLLARDGTAPWASSARCWA